MNFISRKSAYIGAVCLLALAFFLARKPVVGYFMRQGDYYFNGGTYNLEKAEAWYHRASFISLRMPFVHYQLARVLFVEGKFDEALGEINKELNLRPGFGRAYYVRGLIYGFTHRSKEAEADYKKILELGALDESQNTFDQRGWAVYNDLAWTQFQQGHFADVEATTRKGLEKYPNNPWLLNSRGLGLINLNKKSEARKILTKALAQAQSLSASDAAKAYPGNDARDAEERRNSIISTIRFNLALASE